ncbi:phospholipase D-like domain-containing protein [Raineya orbicola]|jgi:cardiolipin synthase|uniref:Phosphatidylserine/phosphatidylglycerophosphate/ cardiolipin synthase n=1 Tax=Raineya orbicola TaxID=2016530 RepID=A0A2N3IHV8_9BACT|nr:phospholipase D-like domain-containing protein [Raineya orbicola]PKQ69897.1 Phosphatidylserine/phosphatidylglycerophosphate/cardiolipin synthase [Raineya orbicola]
MSEFRDKVQLVHSGKEYFETLKNILQAARYCIHLQTYIFEEDETGKEIAEILIQKAQEGVKVCVLVDDFGSKELSKKFKKNLLSQGVQIRTFSPFQIFRLRFGRRLHQKIVVSDMKFALIGGINIANKYAGVGRKEWLDFAVLLEGEIVRQCFWICQQFWNKKYQRDVFIQNNYIFLLQQDFIRGKKEIARAYREAIAKAQNEIWIVASYFLPNKSLRRLFIRKAKEGVKIKILLSAISDVQFFKKATEYLYAELEKAGIQIYEYLPSVVHGKVMLVDDTWATVGSYNLNAISEYMSVEMNVATTEPNFIQLLRKDLQKTFTAESVLVQYAYKRRNIFTRFYFWLIRFVLKVAIRFLRKNRQSYLRE